MDLKCKYLKISYHEMNLRNIRDSDFLTIFEFTCGPDILNHVEKEKIHLYQITLKQNVKFVRLNTNIDVEKNSYKILYILPEDIKEFMDSKYFYFRSKKKLFKLRINFIKIAQEYDGIFIENDMNEESLEPEYQKLFDTIPYPLGYMFYPKDMISKFTENRLTAK